MIIINSARNISTTETPAPEVHKIVIGTWVNVLPPAGSGDHTGAEVHGVPPRDTAPGEAGTAAVRSPCTCKHISHQYYLFWKLNKYLGIYTNSKLFVVQLTNFHRVMCMR